MTTVDNIFSEFKEDILQDELKTGLQDESKLHLSFEKIDDIGDLIDYYIQQGMEIEKAFDYVFEQLSIFVSKN